MKFLSFRKITTKGDQTMINTIENITAGILAVLVTLAPIAIIYYYITALLNLI